MCGIWPWHSGRRALPHRAHQWQRALCGRPAEPNRFRSWCLRHLGPPYSPVRTFGPFEKSFASSSVYSLTCSRPTELKLVFSDVSWPIGWGSRSLFTVHGWACAPGMPPRARVSIASRTTDRAFVQKIITVSEFDRRLALEAGIATEDRLVTVHNGMPDVAAQRRAVRPHPSAADHGCPVRAAERSRHPASGTGGLGTALGVRFDRGGPPPRKHGTLVGRSAWALGSVFWGNERCRCCLAESQISVLTTNWEGFPFSFWKQCGRGCRCCDSVGGVAEHSRTEIRGISSGEET